MEQSVFMKLNNIQNCLNDYYKANNRYLTFPEAVETLYKEGDFSRNNISTNYSNFSDWNMNKPNKIFSEFMNNYLDVTPIVNDPGIFYTSVNEDYFLFHNNDIYPELLVRNEKPILHKHDYFEISYVIDGEIAIQIATERRILKTGGLCIVSPRTNHLIENHKDATVILFAIKKSTFQSSFNSMLNNHLFLSEFFKNALYSGSQNFLLFVVTPNDVISTIIKDIFREFYGRKRFSNAICCQYFTIFLLMVMRHYSETYLSDFQKPNSIVSQMPAIITYIEYHYKKLTLQELAVFFNYDHAYLGKQIKLRTGSSFNEIITRLRIDTAKNLLKYSNKKTNEIAEEVGYNSPNHFSRDFRKQTGMTAIEYRKKDV